MIGVISGVVATQVSVPGEWIVFPGAYDSGIGYTVLVPYMEPLPAGRMETTLLTHHVFREDAQQLYGFLHKHELSLFRRLISVSGVGPKTALEAMRRAEAEDIAMWIAGGDVAALCRIKGIGKKTAETLIAALRDSLKAEVTASPEGPAFAQVQEDAVAAMFTLGFPRSDARQRVAAVPDAAKMTTPQLVAAALAVRVR